MNDVLVHGEAAIHGAPDFGDAWFGFDVLDFGYLHDVGVERFV